MKIASYEHAPVERFRNVRASLEAVRDFLFFSSPRRKLTVPYEDIKSLQITHGFYWHGLDIALFEGPQKVLSVNGIHQTEAGMMLEHIQQRRTEVWTGKLDPQISGALNSLTGVTGSGRYIDDRECRRWVDEYGHNLGVIPKEILKLPFDSGLSGKLELVKGFHSLDSLHDYVETVNQQFVAIELDKWAQFFDSVESHPLTIQQRESIIHDECNNLIVAGAGTGKTSTLLGKVGYILEKGLAKPDEILVLAFTNKAAGEIQDRIKQRFGHDLPISTFHKLGLNILASKGNKPTISKLSGEDRRLVEKFVQNAIVRLSSDLLFGPILMKYFSGYMVPYKSRFEFENEGQYIAYLKNNELRTLKDEKVKSFEECQIANFLTLNGIRYEYEKKYEHDTTTPEFQQYRPDFYLPDYKIYIEHYGIDRNGRTAPYIDKEKYNEGIEWKKQTHTSNGTTLITTYSYEASEGILTQNLEKSLKEHNVPFKPVSMAEFIRNKIVKSFISKLAALISRFLTLFKSMGQTIATLREKASQMQDRIRAGIFVEVFSRVYEEYENHLSANNEIDFNDMIIKATDLVKTGAFTSPFKYILVDEFQDISWSRYQLVKALADQKPDTKTVCVGDDWQSIYRFSGSDISVMIEFREYFGYTKQSLLEQTFRFGEPILDFSTAFITKNPKQIKKHLVSRNPGVRDSVKVVFTLPDTAGQELFDVLSEIDSNTNGNGRRSVFILGRYKHDCPKGLPAIHCRFRDLDINFLTIHSAKGLQADYVVLLNVGAGKYGFPSEISDDPLLDLVMVKPDPFPNSEERRLFYVAVTRARKQVYILADLDNPSSFITEITSNGYGVAVKQPGTVPTIIPCPKCITGRMVTEEGEFGRFVSCSNYPYCEEKAVLCRDCGVGVMVRAEKADMYRCSNEECGCAVYACEKCGSAMVKRKNSKDGSDFYGCSKYPHCDFTRSMESTNVSH